MRVLTGEEACRILAAAADRRGGARWSVALALGIRQSEAIGLRWKFVHLDAGTIEVGWQLRRARYRHGCDDPAACTAGRHRVPWPPGCDRHRHRAGCADDCAKRGHRCPQVNGRAREDAPPTPANAPSGPGEGGISLAVKASNPDRDTPS